MIPKEVTDALEGLTTLAYGATPRHMMVTNTYNIVNNFLETTDRYVKELEQHVDDLVAGQHGIMEDD